ncbi:MAG: hypothetical protein H0U18_16960 [Pyrinomonadaceae bacterium]|nr:hypothetical protein [Pyrinomonadaceae bacterium]
MPPEVRRQPAFKSRVVSAAIDHISDRSSRIGRLKIVSTFPEIRTLSSVKRATHTSPATIQHMGVDHGRMHIFVGTKGLLRSVLVCYGHRTDRRTTLKKPLLLWPGVVAAVLLILVRFVVPVIAPEATYFGLPATFFGVIGGVFCGLAIVVWWVFLSRAPWPERLGAVGLMIVALFATSRIVHVSIANGAMGMLFPILAIPVLSLAFVAWAVASRRLSNGPRRAAMIATILLACGVSTLVRPGGFTANFDNDFAWRGRRLPRSGSWPKLATSRWRSRCSRRVEQE